MDSFDNSDGLDLGSQDVSMDVDMAKQRSWVLPLKILMDVDIDLAGGAEYTDLYRN
jgi:hypothetical protein